MGRFEPYVGAGVQYINFFDTGTGDNALGATKVYAWEGDRMPEAWIMQPETMRASYDAAICLYHDQALIPVKMLDFWGGVNVTLGLPIVRTSPDHGTAFDIAGRGLARPDSLIAAIRLADQLASTRANVVPAG
jgi:hypothetical protein